MTTNQTIDEINFKLDEANRKDVNIKITSTTNTSVDLLHATIANQNGQLKTSIYHKPGTEPYILSYSLDHPQHIVRNIPYATLLHAARICSHVDEFNFERIRIDVSLLLNNYPPSYISQQFSRFFEVNNPMSLVNQLDEHAYRQLHQKLLYQPTRREKQLNEMMQDPPETLTVMQTKIWDKKLMFPHYMFHGKRSNNFLQVFYKWWQTYYYCDKSPVHDVRIRLIPDTYRTLESFFIHKKPSRDVLTKMETI